MAYRKREYRAVRRVATAGLTRVLAELAEARVDLRLAQGQLVIPTDVTLDDDPDLLRLVNATPRRIRVVADGRQVVVPPLGQTAIARPDFDRFAAGVRALEDAQQARMVTEDPDARARPTVAWFLLALLAAGSTAPVIWYLSSGVASRSPWAALLGVLYVMVLSTFPAAVCVRFALDRLPALRAEWVRNLFRLDPGMRTVADIDAKYGDRLDAQGMLTLDARRTWSPVLAATVISSIGWTLVVDGAGRGADGGRTEWWGLDVEQALFAAGFLGAYIDHVRGVLRDYFHSTLGTESFARFIVRAMFAGFAAFVVGLTFQGLDGLALGWLSVVVFVIGAAPPTWLDAVREAVTDLVSRKVRGLVRGGRLDLIEGLDRDDRLAMSRVGVTDVGSLAHSDLADLMMSLRLPMARIMDVQDQALLITQVMIGEPGDDQARCASLRALGIRTATDLIKAIEHDDRAREIRRHIDLESVVDAIERSPTYTSIKNWTDTMPGQTSAELPEIVVTSSSMSPTGSGV